MKESQLENKTLIATNDYVRMVDENGNSVKIKKDSFMAAIRDALPSIISDGATDRGSVLSVIGGALKTRTDANLASVLGAGITKKRPTGTVVELFKFTVTNAETVIQMNIFFPNYKDVLGCNLTFVSTNNNNVCYGFTEHLKGRSGGSYESNVKLYLEKDEETSNLYHVKGSFSVSVAANVHFYERFKRETNITYVMSQTTIGGNAILLGTTIV